MSTVTVLVVLRDSPRALLRLLARCGSRGWEPITVRSRCDGERCEVSMRLRVDTDEAHVRAQLARLVDVLHVAVDTADVPDGVAFAAVRRKAPFLTAA